MKLKYNFCDETYFAKEIEIRENHTLKNTTLWEKNTLQVRRRIVIFTLINYKVSKFYSKENSKIILFNDKDR